MSARDGFKTYSHGDILRKEAEIKSWESRLADAREKIDNATSRNARSSVIAWDNIKNVLAHLNRELDDMRKAERS